MHTQTPKRSPFARLDFGGFSGVRTVLQTEAAECGLACLAMVVEYHGFETDITTLRRRFPVSQRGTSLRRLMEIATAMNLSARPVRVELESLSKLSVPAILHWDLSHFVVLDRVRAQGIDIIDPALGTRRLSFAEASKHFTGVALELRPTAAFERRREKLTVPLAAFWTRSSGFKRSLAQLLVLTLVLQLFSLASPFYVQLVVDEGLVRQDADFIAVLALGFGLSVFLSTTTTWLRSQAVIYLGHTVSVQMAISLFRHLMRLPIDYFEKRNVGDLVSRFDELGPIRQVLTTRVVSGVVDGIMALSTLAFMFLYSPTLTAVALLLLVTFAGVSSVVAAGIRRATREQIAARASETSNFMETLRGMQSIKSFGREGDRELLWQDRFLKRVNHGIRVDRLQATDATMQHAVQGIEQVLLVYLAAKYVLSGDFSVGMLFAFMTYRKQFSDRFMLLVEHVREIQLVKLHLERLADVVFAEPEVDGVDGLVTGQAHVVKGALKLVDAGFRYSPTDPWVFSNVNLSVREGETVVITGPSGEGKSTLLKVMMGLLAASEGEVRVDGQPLAHVGLKNFRLQSATVMQDDRLLAGSIVDNICFFEPEVDMERVVQCAQLAFVHEDIMSMPMQYSSLVGDMGTMLSAGQTQRILLARALYKRPKVLFMDEGTANLDDALERHVNQTLSRLPMTRVIVAHRPDVFSYADRVLVMTNGQLEERPVQRAGQRLDG